MADGGATWATAGVCDVGGTNTFDLSTTTAGGTRPYFPAYWTYFSRAAGLFSLDTLSSVDGTPSAAATVLTVYTGDETTHAVLASDDSGALSATAFTTNPGVTYTFMVGTPDDDGDTITSYVLSASFTAYTPTGPRTKIIDGTVPAPPATTTVAWSDDDDSTYIDLSDTTPGPRGNWGSIHATYPNWRGLDVDPAWVTAIGANVRMGPSSGTADHGIAIQLDAPVSRLLAIIDGIGVAQGINDYAIVFASEDYDTTGWAPDGMASALAEDFLYFRIEPRVPLTAALDVRVYEQHLVIYYTIPPPLGEGVPPLRLYPRTDGLGTSTAARLYPPSRSVQASNRRAGGYA